MEYISLDKIAVFKQGKQVPIDKQSLVKKDNMVRFVRIVDYTNTSESPRYIEDFGERYWVDKSDIVMIRYGSQTAGTIVRGIPGIIANNMFQVDVQDQRFNVDFMFYYLSSSEIKHMLMNGQSSSTMPAITFGMMKQIMVPIFSLEDQNRVASILQQIENKINLNTKINNNLLQQASSIFKAWFIDPDISEHEDWQMVTLEDITSLVTRGIAPKYSDESDQIVINQKCIRDHMLDLSPARKHLPKKINEKWLKKGDFLINSTGQGTLGRAAQIWFDPVNMTVDSHVTIVRPKNEKLIYYIGIWGILHEREIESLHTGSTGQTELPRDRVKGLELLLPDENALDQFNSVVKPITEFIISNQNENIRLADLRDSLLPKLMSGEIDVSDINF
ncbi:restriction endonuclease subunit S [Lachnospiraceae bacterium CLA-AA-H246]|uniref:Restriction endonuclease subunit S n=1 Tax=Hominisplanchenecus faecis TaxID=2885351 RepID=A0ABS8ERB2_9FIRM|nr:restriction endonuclease subunit S [Hominisplanchenecus faecis]MCC2147705.1 restriction endonuclease subunit S [Hominisplanchenecus faecis]